MIFSDVVQGVRVSQDCRRSSGWQRLIRSAFKPISMTTWSYPRTQRAILNFPLETLKKVKLGIMEGRLVFVFVILECFIFNLKKDWSTSKFLFLDTSCFHLILPKNVAAEGLCWWCSQPPLGQRPELQAKWFQHVAGQCTSDWHTWSY